MSEILLTAAVAAALAFGLGMYLDGWMARHMWLKHRYCPTCDRLTTDQEGREA